MAKWRALHGTITSSPEVLRLSEFQQLLFTWMIPHADDWGVITGDPIALRARVMPGSSRAVEDFDRALTRMAELGLIWRYEPNGEGPLIQFPKWDKLQPIRKDRRLPPEHTLYLDCPADAGHTPGTSQPLPGYTRHTIPDILDRRSTSAKNFSVIFTEETDVLVSTGTQAQEMDAFMGEIPEDWFRAACKAGVDRNARNWAYVRKICERCRDDGVAPGVGKRGKSDFTDEQLEQYTSTFGAGHE